MLKDYWGWQPGDVLIHALPIFHVHGLFVASHGALLNGSRMIWFGRFDARAVVARLPEATVFMGVPTLYVRMLAEPGLTREACAHMRLFISGSAPLLIETFNAWRERTGHTILERYGMSETVMLTSNPYRPESARRGGTVGLALPGVGVRVHDDQRQPAAGRRDRQHRGQGPERLQGLLAHAREDGRRVHHRPLVQDRRRRPHRQPTATSPSSAAARTSSSAAATTSTRPRSRACINELPGVAESAVVGVPHPDFGEAVVAVVVPRARRRARRRGDRGRAAHADRQFQGAQAGVRGARTAAQCDGQGAEEPAARRSTAGCSRREQRPAARRASAARAAAAPSTAARRARPLRLHDLTLSAELLARLRERYTGCLCLACLQALVLAERARSRAGQDGP